MPDRRGRLFNGEYYLTMVRHLFDGAEEPRTEDAAVKLPWASDAG